MKCEGHATSVTKEKTAVITIDAEPNAVKGSKIEEILKSFGFSKGEENQHQDDKKEKTLSYEIIVSDAEKAKSLTTKFSQKLPELIDHADRKVINNAIDDLSMTKELTRPTEQKRRSRICIIIKIGCIRIKITIYNL